MFRDFEETERMLQYLQHGNETGRAGGLVGSVYGQFGNGRQIARLLSLETTPHSTVHVVIRTRSPDGLLVVYSLMCVLSLTFRQLETGFANTLHREKKNYDSS